MLSRPAEAVPKRQHLHGYEGEVSGMSDVKEKFYRNYFLCILDQGILSVVERLAEHNDNFGFLYNIQTLRSVNANNLKKHCMDLDLLLQDSDARDVNGMDLCHEIRIFCQIVDLSYTTPIQCLRLLYKTRDSFPNLAIALRIMLTMPITTAMAEISFSKLKIIKNYMRTTIDQERLSNLTLLSIERELCESLDFSDLINSLLS
jgi:hypothetical protein